MKVVTYKNIKYFQSHLFERNNFIHAFFTKNYKYFEPKELQNKLDLNSNIHFLNQVHSNKVIKINNNYDQKNKIADSLITKEKNQSLWIYTADCMPILIADIKTRNIAACHSGLEGLKKNIISETLNSLVEIGSRKSNLIIAIGPSITGFNYQVKKNVVEDLIIQISGKRYTQKSTLINLNKEKAIPLFKKDTKPDRLLFDIQAAGILQLYKEDIKQSQIDISRLCTFSNPKIFNSFRRDNTKKRQWSCIYS